MRPISAFLIALALIVPAVPGIAQLQAATPTKADYLTEDAKTFAKAKAAYDRGDFETAFPAMKKLAEAGHAKAQFYVGEMYNGGLGVPRDTAVAIEWYRRSAEQGDPDGIQMLGQGMRLMMER